MTLQIIMISLTIILLWWLSGLLPGRPIKPKNNRWHAWGPFDQVWGYIDGDKKSLLPKSMPWPFHKVFTTLNFTKFVEDTNNGAYEENSIDGKKIKYASVSPIIHGIKKQVRTVTEEVTRLRKTETHPYVVKLVLPKAGGTFYLVFTLKIKMKNPMKTLKLEEFLLFVGNQLSDRMFPWGVRWEKETVQRHLTIDPSISREDLANLIIDDILGLDIDKDDCIILKVDDVDINLKTYMNNRVVSKFGGVVEDFSLDVGYDENIKKIIDSRNEQTQEEENRKLKIKKGLTRAAERAIEKDDADQERGLDQKYLEEVQIPGIQAEADAQATANGSWNVGTLALGDTKTILTLPEGRNKKQKGGINVTT